jgi:hypothetical protein
MKILTQMATLLFCLIVFSGIALAQVNTEYAQIAEDTDIMATIIDKTMEKAFPGEYKESGFFDSGCQGIFLKGYGALFMMDIGFSVVKPPEDKPAKETKADNLWDQTKRELKERSLAYTYTPAPDHKIDTNPTSSPYIHWNLPDWVVIDDPQTYDQTKVERLKNQLLRLIEDYSINIRNLQSDDNITIVIKGGKMNILGTQFAGGGFQSMPNPVTYAKKNEYGVYQVMPDPATLPITIIPDTGEAGFTEEKNDSKAPTGEKNTHPVLSHSAGGVVSTDAVVVQQAAPTAVIQMPTPEGPNSNMVYYGQDLPSVGQKGSRSTMIITVKKRNVTDLKEGRINADEFVKRAEIIQY